MLWVLIRKASLMFHEEIREESDLPTEIEMCPCLKNLKHKLLAPEKLKYKLLMPI